MRHVPPGLLAMLSLPMLQALDDLEHNCDLISVQPNSAEVRWTLERAGLPGDLCALIDDGARFRREPETLDLFAGLE
jgi:hypothetical protein